MGFNKRILKKENIINNLHNLETYLSADCIIISDEFSKEVYKMYCENINTDEIIKYIKFNING
jgi:hypothetical protein